MVCKRVNGAKPQKLTCMTSTSFKKGTCNEIREGDDYGGTYL